MAQIYDYLVIGAGPAGMAAAIETSNAGLSVLVLDQASGAGGQIYRNLGHADKQQTSVLGSNYGAGKPLLECFVAANCDYQSSVQVWHIETHTKGFLVAAIVAGETKSFLTSHLLLAHGAMERPMAITGWHKPGVLTAGAGQILLKSSALMPKEVVLVGSGPLLLLLAQQYRVAGVAIKAILDTTPKSNYWYAIPWLVAGLTNPMELFKGLWLTLVQRIKIPYISGVSHLEVMGDEQVSGVRYTVSDRVYNIDCKLVMLHQGIIAQTQMAQMLRCAQVWNERQQCWQTKADVMGYTSIPGVQVAGDGGSIGGALLAQIEGRVAGMGRVFNTPVVSPWHKKWVYSWLRFRVKQLRWARGLVDRLYRPAEWLSKPADQTIVCRCEQVNAKTIRSIVNSGCAGVNQLKRFTRAGMGACQGRQCGLNLSHLVAQTQQRPMAEVEPLSVRPPLSPINLGQLAKSLRL